MWVVFWTMRASDPKVFHDAYVLVDTQQITLDFIAELKQRDAFCFAGCAPVLLTEGSL